jgi:hypothetical protein
LAFQLCLFGKTVDAKPNSTQPPQIFVCGISRSHGLVAVYDSTWGPSGPKSHGRVQYCIMDLF